MKKIVGIVCLVAILLTCSISYGQTQAEQDSYDDAVMHKENAENDRDDAATERATAENTKSAAIASRTYAILNPPFDQNDIDLGDDEMAEGNLDKAFGDSDRDDGAADLATANTKFTAGVTHWINAEYSLAKIDFDSASHHYKLASIFYLAAWQHYSDANAHYSEADYYYQRSISL